MLLLAACQTDEERAAEHLSRAQGFVAAEDLPRARVEYLNALGAKPNDVPTRFALAEIEVSLNNIGAAQSHMLRIVEQDPQHIQSRLWLASFELEQRNWDAARTHFEHIANVKIASPEIQSGLAIVAYSEAAASNDLEAVRRAHAHLLELLPTAGDHRILNAAVVDGFDRTGRLEAALAAVEDALDTWQDDLEFSYARLSLLNRLDRGDEALDQLERIVAAHPDKHIFRQMLVARQVELGNLDAAEKVLRNVPDPSDTMDQLSLVRFLAEHRGSDHALATLERLVAAHGRPTVLRLLRAAMAFDNSDQDAALAEMQDALAAAKDAGEDTSAALYLLARMLDASGDRPAAETALETLLARAPRHVAAAQLQSVWLLERGRPDMALRLLRTAEGVEPDNATTLHLLARSHEATGNAALGRQLLARAVEISSFEAVPALDYAESLVSQDRIAPASDVLARALDKAPENVALLKRQSALLVAQSQWDRAEAIEGRLRVIGTPPALIAADDLQFRRLASLGEVEQAMSRIALRAKAGEITYTGFAVLARSAIEAGLLDIAQRMLDIGAGQFPQVAELRAVAAELAMARGDLQGAATVYVSLTKVSPQAEALWSDFIALRKRQGAPELQLETTALALTAMPDSPTLAWEHAVAQQAVGNIDAAIQSYEALLDAHPNNAPVRNNLAALLLEGEPDPVRVERAASLVAPLVGSSVPQFLDTVGWVLFHQGDATAASEAIMKAAEALPDNAQVQWHAVEALLAVGRIDEARERQARVADIGDETLAARAQASIERAESSDPGEGTN